MSAAQPRPLGSRYELLDLLGAGAMGEVWRARDRETERELAAKVLRSEFARDTEIVTRFIQERSILMSLRHPNIVAVHDLVVEGDRLGILMDLVEGGDLRGRLRTAGTLGGREAIVATCAVLDALAEAHAQGCLHRDVKPDNVLLDGDILADEGTVKLSDFSIARLAQESTVMATGLLGTPGYMPPELFVHGHFSAASDVYAAGILLYELLAGRTPFAGQGTAHTMGNRHVTAEPPRIPVDDRLWHVVATMLSKEPRMRLTAAGTAQALRALPDEVLDQPALPVQGNPDTWTSAISTGGLGGGPIRVQAAPSQLDPGVTNVRAGRQVTDSPLAGTGEVQAFAPAALTGDPDVTSVGRAAPTHRAPVLTPGAVLDPEKPRRTWLPWVVGAVVLVGLVGGGVAFAQTRDGSGGTDPGDPAAPALQEVTATQGDNPLPSGLTISRQAVYDPEAQQIDLTIRYQTQKAPLTGPFLEVVPAREDTQQCPGVAWEGGDQPGNITNVTGIFTPCGYAVDVGTIPAQSSSEVSATIDIDLGAEPDQALEEWVGRAATLTDESLRSESARSQYYPVQRMTAINVEVPSGISLARRELRVVLTPQWVSGAEDRLTVLYDTTAVGQSTELLDQVAGGVKGIRLSETCGGAVSITPQLDVSVLRSATECSIDAEVGNFEAESPTFTISSLGG